MSYGLLGAQAQAPASGLLLRTLQALAAGFAAHTFLRRRVNAIPVTTAVVASAPAPQASQAGPALRVAQLMTPAPASDKPARRGIARGMAQHAAQAPATPNTASKGFFMVFFLREQRGNSRMQTLKSQAA